MEIARAWEEEGVKIPAPYSRTIKMIFAPDKQNVEEISFSFALIDPGSQTDYHTHDRPEQIYVVSGRGISKCEGEEIEVQGDTVLWVRAGEKHQMRNTGAETLKLATVFVPGYTADFNYSRCLEAAGVAEL
ncbi:MAG: cupin domain-containing protein [Anaerolineae bacterium]|nr:cupin domain-containing protein [Anaerolineae bacterium]